MSGLGQMWSVKTSRREKLTLRNSSQNNLFLMVIILLINTLRCVNDELSCVNDELSCVNEELPLALYTC